MKRNQASMRATLALLSLFGLARSVTAQSIPPDSASAPSPGEYVLQRGDDLEIRAYNMPDLNADVRIRPDGKISVLLINDVQASGLTPLQLSQDLKDGYLKQNFRNPRITVIVKSFASQNVYVGGEIGLPAAVPLRGDLTAVQAILQAGGIKVATASDQVTVVHDLDKDTQKSETISVKDVLSGQKPDIVLRPSDVVYVQKSSIDVYIGGEVVHPGLVPLNGNVTVLAAVVQAGGFRPTAKTDSVVLLRDRGKGTPTATKIKLDDLFHSTPLNLQAFDVVLVPKSRIAKLDEWVDQYLRQMSPAALSAGFSYLFGSSFTGSTPLR